MDSQPSEVSPFNSYFIGIVLTLAFYLSGLFVFLTPLAVLYWHFRYGFASLKVIVPICFAILVLLYLFALPLLVNLTQHSPWIRFLLVLPGSEFLEITGTTPVMGYGLAYFAFLIFTALIIYRILSVKTDVLVTLIVGAGIGFLVFSTLVYVLASLGETHPISWVRQFFSENLNQMSALTDQKNMSIEQIAFVRDILPSLTKYLVMVTPSLAFISLLIVMIINLLIAKRLLPAFGIPIQEISLTTWSLPFLGVWLVILAISELLINSMWLNSQLLFVLGANTLVILSIIYYLQGLSIVGFWLAKWQIQPFFRMMIYFLLILFMQPLGVMVVGLGFFDTWFDFRRLDQSPPDVEKE